MNGPFRSLSAKGDGEWLVHSEHSSGPRRASSQQGAAPPLPRRRSGLGLRGTPLQAVLRGTSGITLLEMVIILTMIGTLVLISYPRLLDNARRERARRSIEAVAREITLARSYAVRSGRPISLIVDGTNLRMLVRDTAGNLYRRLDLGPDRELRVKSLDLTLPGDSLVFSPRGFCLNCDRVTPARIDVQSGERIRSITVNVLGRTKIMTPVDG